MEQTKKLNQINNLLKWIKNIQRKDLSTLNVLDLKLICDDVVNHRTNHQLPHQVADISPELKTNNNYTLLVQLLQNIELKCNYYINRKEEEFTKQRQSSKEKPILEVTKGYSKLMNARCFFIKIIPSNKFFNERRRIGLDTYSPYTHIKKI